MTGSASDELSSSYWRIFTGFGAAVFCPPYDCESETVFHPGSHLRVWKSIKELSSPEVCYRINA